MKRMYMQGRPPWYDTTGSMKKPFVIGVSGGTASGKTTVCKKIIDSLQIRWVVLLSMDSFYKGLNEEQLKTVSEYNFDHPDAFDVEAIASTLAQLKEGKSVEVPTYDFKTHTRSTETKTTYGADVVIFEGILAFYFEELRNLMDMKIFVDEDPDIRLARRLKRDIAERGRDLEGVLHQYDQFVKPSFENYIYPTKKYADIIIPRGPSNTVAIKLITEHIKTKLKAGGFQFLDMITKAPTLKELPPNVKVMKKTAIIRGIHTTIRNKDTPRSEFIYHSHRLSRLLFEEALNHLPYEEKVVVTPTGTVYRGMKMAAELCGVSIMRAGESMETALREVCGGVPILKILIQSENKAPKLFYCKMCTDLPQRTVFLLDPMLATGATVTMAIRVLIDHGVPEDKIYFLNLISTLQGISVLSYTYPKVKIITTEVDERLNDKFYIEPGIGNFGDRYFGTESEGSDKT